MSGNALLDWAQVLGPPVVAGIAAYTAVKVEMAVMKNRLATIENKQDDMGEVLRGLADSKTRLEMQGGRIDALTVQLNELSRRFIDFLTERRNEQRTHPRS